MNDNGIMIEAANLSKTYAGGHQAIKDVTFHCREGEIVGFLGPNGAGKTTTMRILTGYMPPSGGIARIAGYDMRTNSMDGRRRLGYLPETVPLYPEMVLEDYLAFVGRVRRLDNLWERVDDVLESVGLLHRAESIIGTLSKGMRQRVGLAQALLHDPDVLILDEPTIGLDPAQILEVRELIIELGKRHTVLLSTHILSEVEQICDRAIIVIAGKVVADLPLRQITPGTDGEQFVVRLQVSRPDAVAATILEAIPGVLKVDIDAPGSYRLAVTEPDATREAISRLVVEQNWGLQELAPTRTSLEALFMEKLREAEIALPAVDVEEEEEAGDMIDAEAKIDSAPELDSMMMMMEEEE
jgi:ABC-2 type transport system ATP-binding protein